MIRTRLSMNVPSCAQKNSTFSSTMSQLLIMAKEKEKYKRFHENRTFLNWVDKGGIHT